MPGHLQEGLNKGRNTKGNFRLSIVCLLAGLFTCLAPVKAQQASTTDSLTLGNCIDYALQHQPQLQAALIGISVTKANNMVNLSGWLPQVTANGSFVHYFQLPTSFLSTTQQPIRTGVVNTFIPQLSATQTIFSPDVLYAAKAAHLYVNAAVQVTDSDKINIVATVSKAYYNLLLTLQQINILKEDTTRLGRNVRDTYHQYVGGIVDKTDYKEATITFNNTMSQLKQANESITPEYAQLKQLMGYPSQQQFNINYDTLQMIQDISFDTTQQLAYENRIEFQQFQTAKSLQHQQTNYYKYQFLPTLSAYYTYNYEFQNNNIPELYSAVYPNSLLGVTLNWPLFTGLRRIESVRRSKLQERQYDWYEQSLKAEIYTEYTSALANYKSNLYDFYIMQDNVLLAKDAYNVVNLQYKQGIVAYLNVITAESNLITSEIGYLNALFQVLSSKIDLQKSMGQITYNR